MTETNPTPTPAKGRLIAWPLSLLAMTATLLLMTNVLTGCGGHHRGERPDIDEIKEHATEGVEHLMWRLDGTDDQTERLQAIVTQAIDELAVAHGPRDDLRAEFSTLLTAETIDREAMEAMRVKHLDRAERMSRIVTAHLADALDVLTPEQRAKIEERLAKRRGRRGWH